jgi:serine protease Do
MRIDYATAAPWFHQTTVDIDPAGCVAVLSVESDSPAWKAGLRPGVYVSHVDGQRVARPQEFMAAVRGKRQPVEVRLTTRVDAGNTLTVDPSS